MHVVIVHVLSARRASWPAVGAAWHHIFIDEIDAVGLPASARRRRDGVYG